MKVEIADEQLDYIVRSELEGALADTKQYIKKCKKGYYTGVYSFDKKEELSELKKAKKALERVLEMYSSLVM